MLILSRKKNESIMLGDDIQIVVAEIRGDKVRLGIQAPELLPIHRLEVYHAIKRTLAGGSVPPKGDHTLPTVVSARDGHLLLRFRDSADLAAAVARGRVLFAAGVN